jgi:hypothetical protein
MSYKNLSAQIVERFFYLALGEIMSNTNLLFLTHKSYFSVTFINLFDKEPFYN